MINNPDPNDKPLLKKKMHIDSCQLFPQCSLLSSFVPTGEEHMKSCTVICRHFLFPWNNGGPGSRRRRLNSKCLAFSGSHGTETHNRGSHTVHIPPPLIKTLIRSPVSLIAWSHLRGVWCHWQCSYFWGSNRRPQTI